MSQAERIYVQRLKEEENRVVGPSPVTGALHSRAYDIHLPVQSEP